MASNKSPMMTIIIIDELDELCVVMVVVTGPVGV